MKRTLLILLGGLSFLILARSGQAQAAASRGPIRLEDARPSWGSASIVYQLHRLKVSDTKPTHYVWLFQRKTEPSADAIEPDKTVFQSLDSPALLSFISRPPPGVRICHSPLTLPSLGKTQAIGSDEPGLLNFISVCRRSKIEFVFGTAF